MRILIAGPDGSGKSTIADMLTESLRADGVGVQRLHYRPGVLLSRRAGAGEVAPSAVDDPHGRTHRGVAASVAKVLVTFADVVAADVLGRRSGSAPGVVIQERGWWDQDVDSRRYRLHPRSCGGVRALGRVLPRPDLAVVLTGPPALIHRRKPELPVDEIDRQSREWLRRAPRIAKRHIVVDVRDEPWSVADRVLDAMGRR